MGPDKKQQYHLEPPKGLMNDPNGLVWFRDRYYVFFQWNRYKKDHSHKEWGMFTSKDLVDWEFDGGAIRPGDAYDCSGVHSGSALVIDGKLCAFYTGSRKGSDGSRSSSQCLAVSEDGIHFKKKGVILTTPKGFTEHFRDPKVFRMGQKGYGMVLGGQQESGKGSVVLCNSVDGRNWNYVHKLAEVKFHEMIECPDLFSIDGQYVLLYCLQRRDNAKDQVISAHSFYRLVSFDEDQGFAAEEDLEQDCRAVDDGFDFFAPQTFEAPDGRRILLAWMSRMEEDQERIFAEGEPRIHCLTLPRELKIIHGKLYQKPVRELYRLLGRKYRIERTCDGRYIHPDGRTWRLSLKGKDSLTDLHLNLGETELGWDGKRVIFSRRNWAGESSEVRSRRLERLEEVEVWSDASSIEIFLNGGEAAFSARTFPREEAPVIVITGADDDSELKIQEIKIKRVGGDRK